MPDILILLTEPLVFESGGFRSHRLGDFFSNGTNRERRGELLYDDDGSFTHQQGISVGGNPQEISTSDFKNPSSYRIIVTTYEVSSLRHGEAAMQAWLAQQSTKRRQVTSDDWPQNLRG